jgi:cobalt-zinc-cadmium resistance protein CzcA
MVVRLDSAYRKDITDVETLFVPLPNGGQIPLQQVAEVIYKLGPAQISREDGKRRIVVGLNVKDRDVQSVVEDMQKKIEADVKLPIGYYVTYGGQFENLKEATQRLTIAVPVALLMILILLYLTFSSMKQALLIFSAIPLVGYWWCYCIVGERYAFQYFGGYWVYCFIRSCRFKWNCAYKYF